MITITYLLLHNRFEEAFCHPLPQRFIPAHATRVTDPSMILLAVATAGLAGIQLAVETLALAVHQELEWL